MRMRAFILAPAVLVAAILPAAADDDSGAATIVADQVRSQGYDCSEPATAAKDAASSKPDVPVYVLTCANATYRVEVIPDQGAKITTVP